MKTIKIKQIYDFFRLDLTVTGITNEHMYMYVYMNIFIAQLYRV